MPTCLMWSKTVPPTEVSTELFSGGRLDHEWGFEVGQTRVPLLAKLPNLIKSYFFSSVKRR